MGTYLNPGNSGFAGIRNDIYIDKSGLISLVNETIETPRRLTCVSRPRRFGKSFAAQMLCAYYDKCCDSAGLFDDLEKGIYQPAAVISAFEEEQEQRAVAEIFNTQLYEITTPKEREKAFHDILYSVKKNSFEFYSGRMGTDVNAINQVISGKKALEELSKTHISL